MMIRGSFVLKLVDNVAGPDGVTSNFDLKHMYKVLVHDIEGKDGHQWNNIDETFAEGAA